MTPQLINSELGFLFIRTRIYEHSHERDELNRPLLQRGGGFTSQAEVYQQECKGASIVRVVGSVLTRRISAVCPTREDGVFSWSGREGLIVWGAFYQPSGEGIFYNNKRGSENSDSSARSHAHACNKQRQCSSGQRLYAKTHASRQSPN